MAIAINGMYDANQKAKPADAQTLITIAK